MGIEPPNMVKVEDAGVRFTGGETSSWGTQRMLGNSKQADALPISPTPAIIAMSLHFLQP